MKLQSDYKTINITDTTASNPVILKNGQNINITKTYGAGYNSRKTIYNPSNSFSKSLKVINKNDTKNLYAVNDQLINLEGKLGVFVYKLIKVNVKIEYPYTSEFKDVDYCYVASLENAKFFECLKNNKENVLKENGYILQEDTIGPVAISDKYDYGNYYEYIDHGDNNDEIIDAVVADISHGSGTYGMFNNFVGEDGKTYCIANKLMLINSNKIINYNNSTDTYYVLDKNISILSKTNKIIINKVKGLKTTKQTTKDITLKWDKVNGATEYQVYQYDSKTKRYKLKATATKTTYKISKLSEGTTYKFKLRAYKVVNGKKYYGSYSSVLTTTTKTKASKILETKAGKKKFTLKWKRIKRATGYEVQYSTNKKFKKENKTIKITKNKITSTTVKKLKANKKYFVRIRTYRTVKGTKYYSSWSKSKKIITKK